MRHFIMAVMAVMALSTGAANANSFLNSTEIFMPGKELGMWKRVYEKATKESQTECAGFTFVCLLSVRNQYMDRLVDKSMKTQLEDVNSYYNSLSYRTDANNYQISDYWATPAEFVQRGGDCEDYAIAKFFSLRKLGWPKKYLRLAIVKDSKTRINHAILMAWLEDRWYALDNMNFGIVPDGDERLKRYTALFSVNELGMWRHR